MAVVSSNFAFGIHGRGNGLRGIRQRNGQDAPVGSPEKAFPTATTRVCVPSSDLASRVDGHWRRVVRIWYIKHHNVAVALSKEAVRGAVYVGVAPADLACHVYRGPKSAS